MGKKTQPRPEPRPTERYLIENVLEKGDSAAARMVVKIMERFGSDAISLVAYGLPYEVVLELRRKINHRDEFRSRGPIEGD